MADHTFKASGYAGGYLLEICGAKVPTDRSLDGRDIRPLLSNKLSDKKEVAPFKFIYSYNKNQPAAIRQGPWKLHILISSQLHDNYGFKASRSTPLLFQVEQDLGERFNRVEEQPEIAQSLLKELEKHEAQVKTEGTYWDK